MIYFGTNAAILLPYACLLSNLLNNSFTIPYSLLEEQNIEELPDIKKHSVLRKCDKNLNILKLCKNFTRFNKTFLVTNEFYFIA